MPLPLLDEHSVLVNAGPAEVWPAVRRYAHSLAHSDHAVLGRVLGTVPSSGFELAEEVEHRCVVLTGGHRFAHYRLVFGLEEEPGQRTMLSAASYAAFRGAGGRLYRSLLLGTRGHVLAVRHMLRSIRREVA